MSASPKPKPYSLMPPHDRMTPDEALEWAKRRGMKTVIILGEDKDGNEIQLCFRKGKDGSRPLRNNELVYALLTTMMETTGALG